MRAIYALFAAILLASIASAQVATGGDFTLLKTVIAGGGTGNSNGPFDATSTAGQAAAGGPKSGSPFSIYSGFWTADVPIPSGPCPLGQGYWKNTPGAWTVSTLILGDESYTKSQSINILNTSAGSGKKSDVSIILAYQLIAAKLNVANGVDATPIASTIAAADALLAPHNGKLPYKVMSSTAAGQNMVTLAAQLESFNKDMLTPGCLPKP